MTGTPSSLRAKVLAGLVWSVVRNWGGRLLSLLTFMVLARFVGPEEVGLLAAATVVLAFAELFVEQGFVSAIVQRPTITAEQVSAAFILNLAVAMIAFIAIVLLAPRIAAGMRIEALADILPIAALVIPLHALGFCQRAMAQRQFLYKALALRALTAQVIAAAIAIVMVVAGFGVEALIAQSLVAAALGSALLWWQPPWRPTRRLDFDGLKPLLRYSIAMLGSQVLNFGNTLLVQVLLAASMGAATLGLYTVGVRVYATLMQLFTSAVISVAHGAFARLAADQARLRAAYRRAVASTAVVALPAFTMTAVAAPELVELLFGAKWLPSASVMAPMALLGAVQSLQHYNGSVFEATGKPSLTLLMNATRVATTVAALLIAHDQSLSLIAWAFVAGQLAPSPLSYALLRRQAGVRFGEILRLTLPVIAACTTMVGIAVGLRMWPDFAALALPLRLVMMMGIAGLAGAAICLLLARESVASLRELLRRK